MAASGRGKFGPKFGPEVARVLVDARRDGKTDQEAAALAGVSRKTLYAWLRRGDGGDGDYVSFAARYRVAPYEYQRRRSAEIDAALGFRPAA